MKPTLTLISMLIVSVCFGQVKLPQYDGHTKDGRAYRLVRCKSQKCDTVWVPYMDIYVPGTNLKADSILSSSLVVNGISTFDLMPKELHFRVGPYNTDNIMMIRLTTDQKTYTVTFSPKQVKFINDSTFIFTVKP